MREIKFRAYYKPKEKGKEWEEAEVGIHEVVGLRWKEWHGQNENAYLSEGFFINIKAWNDEKSSHLMVLPNEVELMEWTGLFDKNGKEIYEGDICLLDGSKNPKLMNYHRGGFYLDNIYGGIEAYRMEIIGNIYENPELLK